MNIERAWNKQGRLDALQERKRELFINFGRESDPDKRKKMVEIFEQLDRKYRELLPFQQYQRIKQQELRIRILLQQFESEEHLKEQQITKLNNQTLEMQRKLKKKKIDVQTNMNIRKMLAEINQMNTIDSLTTRQRIGITSIQNLAKYNQSIIKRRDQLKRQISASQKTLEDYEFEIRKQKQLKDRLEYRKKDLGSQLNDLSKKIFKLQQKQEIMGVRRSNSVKEEEKEDKPCTEVKVEGKKRKSNCCIYPILVGIIVFLLLLNIYRYIDFSEYKEIRNDICQ